MSTTSVSTPPAPAATERRSSLSKSTRAAALIGILALVVALGVFDAAGKSIWFDEGVSVAVAKLPWANFVHTIGANEANMSLYYLLLRPWIALGGSGEAWIRFLSVIFAVGTVAALYALARRLFGFRVAIIAALLTATNGFFVQFSQEARSYMLVTMLVTIATYAFVRGVEEPGSWWWVLYVFAVSLSVYGHFFALFFPLAHVCSLPFLPRDRWRWRPLAVSLAISAVLVIPALRVAYLRRNTQVWWHPPVTPRQLVTVFAAASGGGGPLPVLATAALGVLATVGAIRVWRRLGPSPTTWHQAVALGMFIVPTLGILGICALEENIQIRYFSVVVPALALAVSLGIAQIKRPVLTWLALGVMVVLGSVGVVRWYGAEKEDWRGAVAAIQRDGSASDAVILFDPYRIHLLEYYGADREASAHGRLVYPEAGFEPFPFYRAEKRMSRAAIAATTERADRLWVLVSDADRPSSVSRFERTLGKTHRRVRTEQFFRMHLVEWQRKTAA
jgi:mannosyltransferase